MKTTFFKILLLLSFFGLMSCGKIPKKVLPILGEKHLETRIINGKEVVDSIPFTVPNFGFVDQDSQLITQQSLKGKVYLVDFFFTSCPSICPKVKRQMLRVYEKYKDNPNVVILSHTIDYKHDSVDVLKRYANNLGVSSRTWHFLYGTKDSVYAMARQYLVAVSEDESAPGGYTHSGNVMLLDSKHQIRGYYDGTKEEDMENLINDIQILFNN